MQQHFKNIFGLSASAPACLSSSDLNLSEADVTRSDSGIYLDEMDQLNLAILDAAQDCGVGSIWDLMGKARKNALKELETSLLAGLSGVTKQAREPYAGFIGQPTYRGLLNAENGSRQSLKIKLPYLESVSMKIKRIGLILNSSATVGVHISGMPDPFEVVVAQTTPSFYTFTNDKGEAEPLEIPFDGREVEFSYVVDGFLPYKNETSCGCGAKDRKLAEFFKAEGGGQILHQEASGIIIDAEISCSPKNVIFLNAQLNLSISNVIAFAARFKAAELLIERILNSDMINRYTMMDPQYLLGKRNHFRKEYQDRVNWLISPDGLDLSKDSCYVCKKTTGFRKVGILS